MKKMNIVLPLIAVVIVFLMLMGMVLDRREPVLEPSLSTKMPQLSFIPSGFKRGEAEEAFIPKFDPRFAKISPITAFKIPEAVLFSAPMGTATGAFTYNAQKFWEHNIGRGGNHSGDDLNGIGGQNSDLGDPVYSVADGYVVYAGVPSLGWGQVVLVAHRVDGRIIQSMYAHLEDSLVTVGEIVKRGQKVGSVGTANGIYLAHLHFEMREGSNLYIGPGYLKNPGNRISSTEFLAQYQQDERIFVGLAEAKELGENRWQDLNLTNPKLLFDLEK